MNWTIEQLKTFVTAVKCGSFSAVARHLGKAQSRVSTAINNLETDFGFELFDRSQRLPRLTERGEELYSEALAGIRAMSAFRFSGVNGLGWAGAISYYCH